MKINFLLILIICISCTPKIDTFKGDKNNIVKNGYFENYSDHNIFHFKSKVYLTMDTVKIYPKSFEVSLPKGLTFYEINYYTEFEFYYKNKQVIFIKTIAWDHLSKADTTYVPKEDEIMKLVSRLSTSGNKKNNINNIRPIKGRKNLIIENSERTIVLYNIKKNNFEGFKKNVEGFKLF